MTTETIGVLFMAYGGPESLEDLPGYLSDIRHGRTTNSEVLEEITHNYASIGGKSPLLGITKEQAAKATELLNKNGVKYKAYLGMRHWAPWIEETVRDMLDEGIKKAVAIVLAPHYSSLSVAKYHQKVKAGLDMFHGHIDFEFIDSYHNHPKYIQAMVNRVKQGIAQFPEGEDVHVVLSAHSLPERIIKMGDPYQDQLFESARLIAEGAGLKEDQWSWSYQSAGRSPEPWLGPQLEDHVVALHEKGVKNVVSVVIGFVSDHVEILYDIDIKAQAAAKEMGMTLVRPPSLNTDPLYMETLAELIEEKAKGLLG
ncbi:ferrochelatase [Deinococcus cellulosilyticus]|uniref:Ferrochelatase n=1 Tax=Deinococcus cellulosilyticus (strain DSM 18568 / NBRC 106333 / KACC 11606 / 5516J-15) TaxID=1223518 RepID=A0A511NB21_DEIC1|nr:ferrochelatase [Deinococcus cellulosilyticus]GEM49581.1 ferrochelatase [Deinococcus cellulosilyticus NBRC 106333 = KACC 11606]